LHIALLGFSKMLKQDGRDTCRANEKLKGNTW
jgi:hypothetical protein